MNHNTNDNMPIYKIAKPILGFIYKLWYNPTLIGIENIPNNGPFIIAGNHVHLLDQCNVIISTKRKIHFLAKMEYFDKNSKVGKFAWFFRGSGCIPVDREKKDKEATSMALEVLNNNHALGVFPEGTRNKLKDKDIKELYDNYALEDMNYDTFYNKIKDNKKTYINYLIELRNNQYITQDEFDDNLFNSKDFLDDLLLNHRITLEEYINHSLLPFKYGVVSMASKTKSVIVPYAITGTYKFRSKDLTIRFGEAFTVEEDLETANIHFQEKVKKLMKESLKNSGK